MTQDHPFNRIVFASHFEYPKAILHSAARVRGQQQMIHRPGE